jgi:hypothetical protein
MNKRVREAVELDGGTVVVYEDSRAEVFVQGGPKAAWKRTRPVVDPDGHYDRDRAMHEAKIVVEVVREAADRGLFGR